MNCCLQLLKDAVTWLRGGKRLMSSDSPKSVCWRCKVPKDSSWNYCPNCNARLKETRNPSPPNPERDISFLYDLFSFGWYNHHVGAVALYESAATINHFYGSGLPEHYSLVVEAPRSQKILRAKIFAEFIALLEVFGVLCLAIAKRKQQSFMWTYLNADPQDVTQFYDRVISAPSPPLQRLLALPRLSDIKKALASGVNIQIAGLPDDLPQLDIDHFIYDYENHIENVVLVARMYREQNSANVLIYNKIKHVFPMVEGAYWLDRPLGPQQAGIAIDDKGTIAPLPMGDMEVDIEILNTHLVTRTGAELMAVCLGLARLGLL